MKIKLIAVSLIGALLIGLSLHANADQYDMTDFSESANRERQLSNEMYFQQQENERRMDMMENDIIEMENNKE